MSEPTQPTLPSLFRAQALAPVDRSLGLALPWLTPKLTGLWALLILLFLVVVVSVARLSYASKATVTGYVRGELTPVTLVSMYQGRVAQVLAMQDQLVEEGQPIFIVNQHIHDGDGRPRHLLELKRLRQQQEEVSAAIARGRQRYHQQQQSLRYRQGDLDQQAQSLGQQLGLLTQREHIANERWRRSQTVAVQGWMSANDLASIESDWLIVKDQWIVTRRELSQLRTSRRRLGEQRQKLWLAWQNERAELREQSKQIEHVIAKVTAQAQFSITAPMTGVLADVQVEEGDSVAPAQAVGLVVPIEKRDHEIELVLSSKTAGQVQAGMGVRIRYQGFPYAEFGAAEGVVERVSQVKDPNVKLPAYQARVRVLRVPDGIDKLPDGMLVEADILLADKPLWAWLLAPAAAMIERL